MNCFVPSIDIGGIDGVNQISIAVITGLSLCCGILKRLNLVSSVDER